MKRLISTVLLVSMAAMAAPSGSSVTPASATYVANLSQGATAANPNLSIIPGRKSSGVPGALHITACDSFKITVCAPNNQTLSGAGTLLVDYYSDAFPSTLILTQWPNNPALTETVVNTTQCQIFATHPTYGGSGWVYVRPSSVTISGGSTVTILLEAVCAS